MIPPKIKLFVDDECLSSLDANLRIQLASMEASLRRIRELALDELHDKTNFIDAINTLKIIAAETNEVLGEE